VPGRRYGSINISKAADVEIELEGGKVVTGTLFIKPQGRLQDMMNDEREFMPFFATDGRFMVIKKTACVLVSPASTEAKEYTGNNPYQILGVSDNATMDQIKEAYLGLVAENHPDRLASMNLSKELLDVATSRMSRINDAYTRIQKQFEAAAQLQPGTSAA
jgi:hypothetical protein